VYGLATNTLNEGILWYQPFDHAYCVSDSAVALAVQSAVRDIRFLMEKEGNNTGQDIMKGMVAHIMAHPHRQVWRCELAKSLKGENVNQPYTYT